MYRVRLSWDSPKSQIGAYKDLQNAIELVEKYQDFKIFDENGQEVIIKKEEEKSDYVEWIELLDIGVDVDNLSDTATIDDVVKIAYAICNPVKVKEEVEEDRLITTRKDGVSCVKIPLEKIRSLDVMVAENSSHRETLSTFQERSRADFVINGGFYFTEKGVSHSLNLLISDNKQNNAGVFSRFGLMVKDDGSISFDNYKWSKDLKHMIGGSPAIISNGVIITEKMEHNLVNVRHPRSAIGITKDNCLVLVAVDGRRISEGLKGMTIKELSEYMISIGCVDAINLDGGGSTRLISRFGVLNEPLENRPVHNAIAVTIKK